MKTKVLHALTVLLALIGTVLAIAAQIKDIPIIPPGWTQYWPVFLGTASALRGLILTIGDLLDDGQLNNSFKLSLLIGAAGLMLLWMSGCGTFSAVKFGGYYQQPNGEQIGGNIELDPRFLNQKK